MTFADRITVAAALPPGCVVAYYPWDPIGTGVVILPAIGVVRVRELLEAPIGQAAGYCGA